MLSKESTREEVLAAWLEALRSGEYSQGKKALKTAEGYCCLGVLCELGVKAGVIPEPKVDTGETVFDGQSQYLPEAIQDWAGLSTRRGTLNRLIPYKSNISAESIASDLADLNDWAEWDFKQIADLVESIPEGLFKK